MKNPCSFYKLMITPSIQSKTLRLPVSFKNSLEDDELSDICSLKVPTGETHQVSLVEEDDMLWFQDGWEEFVNRYSIDYGYFMTFTYIGNSRFRVSIFDVTATEISYETENSASSEQHDNFPGYFSSESSGAFPDTFADMDLEDDASDSEDELPEWLNRYQTEIHYASAVGIQIPSNPFFVATIRSHTLISGYLNLPRPFGRKYIKRKPKRDIMFETSDGNQSFIKCCVTQLNCSFGKGLRQFLQQNGLKAGDVCLFELVDSRNYAFKVHIARASQIRAAVFMSEL